MLQDLLRDTNRQFNGIGSYIRCLAHILNLIVKDILGALDSGTTHEALKICKHLGAGASTDVCLKLSAQTALSRLRILAVWISRSPQRREKWSMIFAVMGLPEKLLKYDDDACWDSTYDILDTALQAKTQINEYLDQQTDLPQFTAEDWHRLSQIYRVLLCFRRLAHFVSQKQPQISMMMPVYFKLHELLHQGVGKEGIFADLDDDVADAMYQGMLKYKKNYVFEDLSDTYCLASILDPMVKGDLLLKELGDESGKLIIDAILESIHKNYYISPELRAQAKSPQDIKTVYADVRTTLASICYSVWHQLSEGQLILMLTIILH